MSIGTFTLVKNESPWIAAHIIRILPFIDEMVFFDGNSTDGTLEIIKAIRAEHSDGHKIKLCEDKDPKDLKDDYVLLFNEAMRSLTTDLAWFLHPDMFLVNPEQIILIKDSPAIAMSTQMRSFGGEPGGQLFEIKGRSTDWKNIYRLNNPDLGAHYHGHYGHGTEDVYFKAITGSSHVLHEKLDRYPYSVAKSGIEILHFSDVRPYSRRIDRMVRCLLNNDWTQDEAMKKAQSHPRVTFKDGNGFKFVPSDYPYEFTQAREKYSHLERSELVKA